MNIESKAAASNALGAKTARPCDSCLIKRARWFCASDDAFLCHSCDAAVHSANQLATRHQRLRLETSSCKPPAAAASPPPAWHHGFTKKARTPRQPKAPPRHHLPLVPELGADDPFPEENEEQLFCRVPVFDATFADDEFGAGNMVFDYDDHEACRELNLEELLGGCEAADVESLLGSDSATGVVDDGKRVKSEDDEDGVMARHLDMEMNWDSRRTKKEEIVVVVKKGETLNERKRMLLRLNYGAVIAAWASQGCPWTDGIRPQFHDLDWLGGSVVVGAGREARVWRYREKRRRRLFCKKIRYQVRKLNAEKRPRMKGRFVKKTPPYFDSTSSSLPNYHFINNKSSII